jgi:hypothetical protein
MKLLLQFSQTVMLSKIYGVPFRWKLKRDKKENFILAICFHFEYKREEVAMTRKLKFFLCGNKSLEVAVKIRSYDVQQGDAENETKSVRTENCLFQKSLKIL